MTASRRTGLTLLVVFFAWPGAAGADNKLPAAAQAILDKAEQLELYSLEPMPGQEKAPDGFHGWKVLGKTEVKQADTRKKILSALNRGIAENTGKVAACFRPRHGIRASHEGKSVDLVICFECYSLRVYVGDQEGTVLVTDSPAPTLNAVLREAKVPLPPPPERR